MANILAVDASTKRSGYAYFEDGEIKYGAIVSSSSFPEKRIGIMRDELIKIIKEHNIDTVVMEEVRPDGYNLHTGKLLTWLQGSIVIATFEYNKDIKFNFIEASSWRSKIGIQGYRVKREEQKKRDIKWANETYSLNLSSSQDDEADAIGILTVYTRCGNGLIKDQTNKNPKIGSEESAF